MKRVAVLAALAVCAHAGAAGAATGLSVSPARILLAGAAKGVVTVGNPGSRPLLVAAGRAGYALTLRGRPRVRRQGGASGWLRVRPRRLRLAPHSKATLHLTVSLPPGAAPGDHPALVLLTTREPRERRVRVLLRVGVVVLVRVPGPTVRRLEPRALSVRRRGAARVLELRLANRGNLAQRLGGGLRLELTRHGRNIATLRARHRLELLPHSAGIAEFVYRGRLRGPAVGRVLGRAFRLTL